MNRLVATVAMSVSILVASITAAGAVTLNFDDLTPGSNIFNTSYNGVFFSSPSSKLIKVIKDNNEGVGWSSPSNSISTSYDDYWMGIIKTVFPEPASFVQVTGGDVGGDIDSFKLEAYDSKNNLLDWAVTGDYGGNPLSASGAYGDSATIAVTGFEISYALLIPTSESGFGISFDDLTYNTAPVPEPCTLIMLGAGLACIVLVGSRRARNHS